MPHGEGRVHWPVNIVWGGGKPTSNSSAIALTLPFLPPFSPAFPVNCFLFSDCCFFFFSQLGAVDATQATNLAQKYGVQGYPTIKAFPAGPKKKAQDYNGPREAAGIVDYATGVRMAAVLGWDQ